MTAKGVAKGKKPKSNDQWTCNKKCARLLVCGGDGKHNT